METTDLMKKLSGALTEDEIKQLKKRLLEEERKGEDKRLINELHTAQYLRRAQEEKDMPFLRNYRLVCESYDNIVDGDYEKSRKWVNMNLEAFSSKAEAGSLTVDQAITVSHVFGANGDLENAAKTLLFLYMDTPNVSRVMTHNCLVLRLYEENKRRTMGDRALKCKLPLYVPLNGKLRLINDRILDATDYIEGGGIDEVKSQFFASEDIRGGGYYEPVFDPTGQQVYAIQMNETENRFNNLQNMFQECIQEMKKSGNKQSTTTRGRGRGVNPRGGYRGSRGGRGRGTNYYGGTDDFNEEDNSSKNNNGL